MRHLRTALSAALVIALATALVPGIALADDRGDVGAQGTTYDIDAFDAAGMGDDTPGGAHDITANIANYGGEWYENHTLDIVDGTTGDVDWVRFDVSDDDLSYETTFLFRTQSTAFDVDTVIEIYGPGSFAYNQGWLSGGGDSLATDYNDEDSWRGEVNSHDSAVLFRPTVAGTYYIRVRPWAFADLYVSDAGPYRLYAKRGVFQRVYGANRIETAVAVSELLFGAATAPGSVNSAVVVADAYNYPDALTGSVIAGISDGVLLLTPGDVLAALLAGRRHLAHRLPRRLPLGNILVMDFTGNAQNLPEAEGEVIHGCARRNDYDGNRVDPRLRGEPLAGGQMAPQP